MLYLFLFSKLKTSHDQSDPTSNGKNTLSVSSTFVNCTDNPMISGPVYPELITIEQRNFLYISLQKSIMCLRSHCNTAPAEKTFSVTHFISSNHMNVKNRGILSSWCRTIKTAMINSAIHQV